MISRVIRATRALVFEALTTPRHVRRWFGLPSLPVSECEIDLRPGGAWRWVLRDPREGTEHEFSGIYHEIRAPHGLAFTERYEATTASRHETSITLSQMGRATELTMRLRFDTRDGRDAFRRSGLEWCTRCTLDALAADVALIRATPKALPLRRGSSSSGTGEPRSHPGSPGARVLYLRERSRRRRPARSGTS